MKVCIVGYGRMGRNHKRVLEELGHEVETSDNDPTVGADWYGTVPTDADAYGVSVPIDQLEFYGRILPVETPLLLEKPGALNLETLTKIRDLRFTRDNVKIGYTERHNPAVQALKENLHRVGEIKHISARRLGYTFDRAGDPALDLATHDLDVIDYVCGGTLQLDHVARTKHHVSALLHHGETTVSIEASHLHPDKVRELEVVGIDGVFRLDYQAQTLSLTAHPDHGIASYPVDKAEPLKREWEAFFDGEGSDGIAAMTIAEQMVEREPTWTKAELEAQGHGGAMCDLPCLRCEAIFTGRAA